MGDEVDSDVEMLGTSAIIAAYASMVLSDVGAAMVEEQVVGAGLGIFGMESCIVGRAAQGGASEGGAASGEQALGAAAVQALGTFIGRAGGEQITWQASRRGREVKFD
ncbi:unnamed protein product [Ilex paraguariensis]|uniref:Uncharacterized protein n=1 Tax=Ilex paraguariensis TaxID=185542 RepID=A0ABC8UYV0_9AQUA